MAKKIAANENTTRRRHVLTRNVPTGGYFFVQATIAMMMPITLKIDIMPAGIAFPVRINLGMNWPARSSATIKPVAKPATR